LSPRIPILRPTDLIDPDQYAVFLEGNNVVDRLEMADMQLVAERPVKACGSMRTIRTLEECMHKQVDTGQILCSVPPYASRHRGHGHSIAEGEEP
jgi:hypothetical protein